MGQLALVSGWLGTPVFEAPLLAVNPDLALVALGFFAVMVFIGGALVYELNLSVLVASMLSVSTVSVGVMVAAAVQHLLGLSVRWTALAMAVLVVITTGLYEIFTTVLYGKWS